MDICAIDPEECEEDLWSDEPDEARKLVHRHLHHHHSHFAQLERRDKIKVYPGDARQFAVILARFSIQWYVRSRQYLPTDKALTRWLKPENKYKGKWYRVNDNCWEVGITRKYISDCKYNWQDWLISHYSKDCAYLQ
jgi:hypothetical protein